MFLIFMDHAMLDGLWMAWHRLSPTEISENPKSTGTLASLVARERPCPTHARAIFLCISRRANVHMRRGVQSECSERREAQRSRHRGEIAPRDSWALR